MKINSIQNVFGINKMTSGVEELGNSCIYASNGLFKTSLARLLFYLSRHDFDKITDRVGNKSPKFDLDISGVKFTQNIKEQKLTNEQKEVLSNIVVFSSSLHRERYLNHDNDFVTRNRFRKVAMSEELQKELEELMQELEHYEEIVKSAIMHDLTEKQGESLLQHYLYKMNIKKINPTSILKICEEALSVEELDTSFVPWSKLNQKAYRDTVDDKDFQSKVVDYLEVLNRKIVSEVFDGKFNDLNLRGFLESIKKTGFISDNRGIAINNKTYYDYDCLEKFLRAEVSKIKLEPEVLDKFEKMDKALGSSVAAREIREFINDTDKLNVLTYKTEGMISSKIYQKLTKDTLETMVDRLRVIEKQLQNIQEKSLKYKNDFEKAVDIFEKRFRPKFTSEIINKDEALLGMALPTIEFYHNDNKRQSMKEEEISEILSSGELSTLKIIHLIVECEAVKNTAPLIIIDDIVETFDYANRVATMEYLHDLSKLDARIILLTHNYDFFRFATSRLRFKDHKGNNKLFNKIYGYKTFNNITLAKNKMREFNLKRMLNIDNIEKFIAIIPLAREIIDIRRGCRVKGLDAYHEDYNTLTYALHYDENGKNISIRDILNAIKRHIPITHSSLEKYYDTNYYEFILKGFFCIEDDLDLEGKLTYAIKIRIMLDRYMLGYMNNTEDKLDDNRIYIPKKGRKNQTRVLFEKNKHLFREEAVEIAEKVLLTTPEYIHFNSFMYEPLIDVSKDDLIELHDILIDLDTVYDSNNFKY